MDKTLQLALSDFVMCDLVQVFANSGFGVTARDHSR